MRSVIFPSSFSWSIWSNLSFKISFNLFLKMRLEAFCFLIYDVIPNLKANCPNNIVRGSSAKSPALFRSPVIKSPSSFPSISSSILSQPKKHWSMMMLAILALSLLMSYSNYPCAFWFRLSKRSKLKLQILTILGIFALRSSKLNNFDINFLLFFHTLP